MTDQATRTSELRAAIRAATLRDEAEAVAGLVETAALDGAARAAISRDAADLVRAVRGAGPVGLMQSFLGEYGLSTKEGVALMCLAEALLRVPDAETIDALISDKIAAADWGRHLGHSSSSLVNASTWALLLTGRVLKEEGAEDLAEIMRGALRRLGEPVIRTATARAMKEMGRQFVLGRTIGEAAKRASDMEAKGYAYSYFRSFQFRRCRRNEQDPYPRGAISCRDLSQKMARGFTGEPVPPTTRRGATTNMNSHRFNSVAVSARSVRNRLSNSGKPMPTIRI